MIDFEKIFEFAEEEETIPFVGQRRFGRSGLRRGTFKAGDQPKARRRKGLKGGGSWRRGAR